MGKHPDSYRKSITDAPNLRDTMAQMCSGCAFYQMIEGTGDGVCSKYEFQPSPSYVCDSYEAMSAPTPSDGMSMEDMPMAADGMMSIKSNALKAISRTDDELRVANYIILNGGRDVSGFSYVGAKRPTRKNPDGTHGEYFTQKTVLDSPHTAVGRFPIGWEHGYEDAQEVPAFEALGYVDWNTKRIDSKGVFVERVLNRRSQYVKWIEELLDEGLIGTSSEADPRLIKVKSTGEIEQWGLMGDTLTVQPAEPRNLSGNKLQAYKALLSLTTNPEAEPEAGLTSHAAQATVTASNAVNNSKNAASTAKENQDMEGLQEILAAVNETSSNVKSFTSRLDAVEKALKAEPPVTGNTAQNVTVTLDEADRPFKSIAANAYAVKEYETSKHQRMHPRLKKLIYDTVEDYETWQKAGYKAAQGASEGSPTDGGLLLDPTLTNEFLAPVHQQGVFTSKVRNMPVSANSNYGWLNGVDETSRATGSRWGGVQGYRIAEAGSLTKSKPKFRRLQWEFKKYVALVYGTDELLADASQFSTVVNQSCSEELAFMLNDDIFEGLGLSGAQGVMTSGSLITVTRTTGSKILGDDISAMWNRMDPNAYSRAEWYIGVDSAPQLDNLFAVGSTAVLYPYASYGANGVRTLYGRPVNVTEFNQTLNTTGDILLADFSQYLLWQKAGIDSATSIHVQFTTDESVFRFIMRADGLSSVYSALTPFHGSTTTSPWVVLGTAT